MKTSSRGWGSLTVILVLVLSQGAPAQEPFGSTQNPIAGSYVFGAKGCVRCHSVNGLGGDLGPDLGEVTEERSFFDLAASMWNHLPSMRTIMEAREIERPRMNSREMGDLIAFLFTLGYFDPAGDVERGERLFNQSRCVVCHQVAGYGGVVGPNLEYLSAYSSPIYVSAAMWNHGPAMQEEMRKRGIQRPTFTSSELVDLIAFLEAESETAPRGPLYVLPGRAGPGEEAFREKGCVGCHSVRGEGGNVGPDLAGSGRIRSEMQFAAAMWNKEPAMRAAMAVRGIDFPRLSPEDMSDIIAYLYSVQYFAEAGSRAQGRQHIRAAGCLACHSLNGRGGDSAGDLAQVRGLGSRSAVASALWNHLLVDGTGDAQGVPWPELGAGQIADITAFLQGQSRAAR